MKPRASYRWLLIGLISTPLVVAALGARQVLSQEDPPRRLIGPTAQVTETSTGVAFTARVDTGAAVTSLHCAPEDCVIDDASEDPWENIGKIVRFCVENREGVEAWIETKIADYREVRSANGSEHRYRIRLPLEFNGVRKETIVNLNDRSSMTYRMLLGRDFLAGDFVVDVSMADDPSS